MQPFEFLYLSPHLDDAVLSCGGGIHQQTAAGRRVGVLTVFAGDLEADPANHLLNEVYGHMGLPPSAAMAIRRREDQTACRRLAAEAVHWQIAEALGRHRELESLTALFAPPPAQDDGLIPELAQRLAEFAGEAEVLAPLGLGGHLDHCVVRRAAVLAFGERVGFYEDFPYVLDVDDVAGSHETAGLVPELVRLEAREISARIDAIQCYASQLRPLFGSRLNRLVPGRGLAAQVRRHVRRVDGERIWRAR